MGYCIKNWSFLIVYGKASGNNLNLGSLVQEKGNIKHLYT